MAMPTDSLILRVCVVVVNVIIRVATDSSELTKPVYASEVRQLPKWCYPALIFGMYCRLLLVGCRRESNRHWIARNRNEITIASKSHILR
jgi:hypothetical protein